MIKGKKAILKGIQSRRGRVVSVYDQYSKEIEDEEDRVKVYKKVLKMYEESIVGKEETVEYLVNMLEDNFFKEAELEILDNSIQFSLDRYKVLFPLDRKLKGIRVVDLELGGDLGYCEDRMLVNIEHSLNKLRKRKDLVDKYLENKSRENIRGLIEQERGDLISNINAVSDVSEYRERRLMKIFREHYTEDLNKKIQAEIDALKGVGSIIKGYREAEMRKKKETIGYFKSLEDYEWLEEVGYEIVVVVPSKNK